jgi:hypothetical protein
MHTLITGGNLNCGTDGGLRNRKGTFGLVVSVEDKIVWEGCGPVDGNPDTASSKRSELFGYYAGLLEFLLMIDSLMLPPEDKHPTTQVNTYIDNSSVVTQLQAFLLGRPKSQAHCEDAGVTGTSALTALLTLLATTNMISYFPIFCFTGTLQRFWFGCVIQATVTIVVGMMHLMELENLFAPITMEVGKYQLSKAHFTTEAITGKGIKLRLRMLR